MAGIGEEHHEIGDEWDNLDEKQSRVTYGKGKWC